MSKVIERTREYKGHRLVASWTLNEAGNPMSEYPDSITVTLTDNATDRARSKGVAPSRLLMLREVLDEMVQDVHKRPDTAQAFPAAMRYLVDQGDALQAPDRSDVDSDYYRALLAAEAHLRTLGLSNPLAFIAMNTGVPYPTLRNRFYTAKATMDSDRG